jgi:hypothetical protein
MSMEVTLKEASRHLGLEPETVRKRLQRGSLSGRKVDGSWLVILPEPSPTVSTHVPDTGRPVPDVSAHVLDSAPETLFAVPDRQVSEPDSARPVPDTQDSEPDSARPVPESVPDKVDVLPGEAVTRLIDLVEKQQEEIRQLAGQVGFLQAVRQTLEEQVRLLQAPAEEQTEEPAPAEVAPPPPRRWWHRLIWG